MKELLSLWQESNCNWSKLVNEIRINSVRVEFSPRKMAIRFPRFLYRKTNGNRLNLGRAWFAHHNKCYALKHTKCHSVALSNHENPIDINSPAKRSNGIRMRWELIASDENVTPIPAKTKTLRRHWLSIWHWERKIPNVRECRECSLSKQLRLACDSVRTPGTVVIVNDIGVAASPAQCDATIFVRHCRILMAWLERTVHFEPENYQQHKHDEYLRSVWARQQCVAALSLS